MFLTYVSNDFLLVLNFSEMSLVYNKVSVNITIKAGVIIDSECELLQVMSK